MSYERKIDEYNKTLANALESLSLNSEWEKRYGGYIKSIEENYYSNQAKFIRHIVQVRWPMAAYLTISEVTGSGINLDLRLFGTSIATLNVAIRSKDKDKNINRKTLELIKNGQYSEIDRKYSNGLVTIDFSDKKNAFDELVTGGSRGPVIRKEFQTKEYWDEELVSKLLSAGKLNWNSTPVKAFRSMVKKVYNAGGFVATNEHACETNMLHLMKGKNLYFRGITPVLLEDSFFQMPTPFKGSKSKDDSLEYSKENGGGIDILARKRLGNKSELCVIELKDQYSNGEEPIKAIKQAIVYSAFLLKLIQTEKANGDKWFKYFKLNSNHEKLNINAVISMPFGSKKLAEDDTFFAGRVLDAGDLGTITLQYIYFNEDIFYDKDFDANKVEISIKRNK